MAPIQRTFTLIHKLPVGLNALANGVPTNAMASKPSMTSKQAKKLYKQAKKQPKLLKAEQHRIELIEQNRICKEFEKKKTQAKAKAACKKKKAKEEETKAAKKKKSLSFVEVHPSQDTISRFVRGNGFGKKRDAAGADVYLETLAEGSAEESDKENTRPSSLARERTDRAREKSLSATSLDGGDGQLEEPRAKRQWTSQPRSLNTEHSIVKVTSNSEEAGITSNAAVVQDTVRKSSEMGRDITMPETQPISADRTNPAVAVQAHYPQQSVSQLHSYFDRTSRQRIYFGTAGEAQQAEHDCSYIIFHMPNSSGTTKFAGRWEQKGASGTRAQCKRSRKRKLAQMIPQPEAVYPAILHLQH